MIFSNIVSKGKMSIGLSDFLNGCDILSDKSD